METEERTQASRFSMCGRHYVKIIFTTRVATHAHTNTYGLISQWFGGIFITQCTIRFDSIFCFLFDVESPTMAPPFRSIHRHEIIHLRSRTVRHCRSELTRFDKQKRGSRGWKGVWTLIRMQGDFVIDGPSFERYLSSDFVGRSVFRGSKLLKCKSF